MKNESIRQKSALSERQLAVLNSEMGKHQKSTGLAYILCIFVGYLGIHKFYAGKAGWGIIYILLAASTAISGPLFFPIAIGTGGILGLLLIIDLFTIPRQLRKNYEKKERKVLQAIATT